MHFAFSDAIEAGLGQTVELCILLAVSCGDCWSSKCEGVDAAVGLCKSQLMTTGHCQSEIPGDETQSLLLTILLVCVCM